MTSTLGPRSLVALALPALVTLSAVAVAAAPSGASPSGEARAASSSADRAPRPNVVLVMADDLGWSDLSTGRTNGGTGSDFFETPTIDRLADGGTAFDNAYAATNCAPTRAALLTGLYAPRPTNNVYQVDDLNRGGDDTLLVGPPQGLPDGDDALPRESVTLGETLQDAGYDTGYVGKFHVTDQPADIVEAHGFDENFGGTAAGHPGEYHAENQKFVGNVGPELDRFAADYTQEYVDTNLKPWSHGVSDAELDRLVGTDKHVSDALADATLDFVDRHDDEPFFVMTSSYAVHTPVGKAQARKDLLAKYQAKPATPGEPSDPSYAALMEGLDQSVARIVDHLETTPDPRNPGHPLADNTVVVFTSDNGGLRKFADNGPLRGQKGELYEGGIRVPMIAWSGNPRLVDSGTINHTPIFAADYHPTLAALARTTPPAVDGRDLSPLIRDADADLDRDALYWHLPGYLIDEARNQHPQSVIRSRQWKLIYSYEDQGFELYDLGKDIGETTDLAAAQPQRVRALGAKLLRWLDDVDAPLATLREGRPELRFRFTGTSYSEGRITQHRNDEIVVEPGDEVPLLVPR